MIRSAPLRLTSQTSQALENVRIALAAAGAGMGPAIEAGMTPTAATLVGVQALFRPDVLVEIEAVAEI